MEIVITGAKKAIESIIVTILAIPIFLKSFVDQTLTGPRQKAKKIIHDYWPYAAAAAGILAIITLLCFVMRKKKTRLY